MHVYSDKHDLDPSNKPASFIKALINNLKSIYQNFLKDKFFSLSTSAYYFWEVSFYLVFIKDIDLISEDFKHFSLIMCVGYLIGVFLLRLINKWHDQHVLKLGYKISICSILFIFIFITTFSRIPFVAQYAPLLGYFIYSLGFGFIVPCLFSMISKTRQPHEQGIIYGLIDSTDTLAFTTAILLAIFVNNFKLIILISFIFLLIGVFIYNISQKHLGNHEKNLKL